MTEPDKSANQLTQLETQPTSTPPTPAIRLVPGAGLKNLLLHYGIVLALVALLVAAPLVYPGFLGKDNLTSMLSQAAPVGIVAVGMTFVIVAGGFDLSVGALYAGGAVLFATLARDGTPLPIAAMIAVLAGAIAGAINGAIVTRLKVNTFVATLGTASVFGGIAYLYSNSTAITVSNPAFGQLGNAAFLGLPVSVWILGVVFVIGAVVLAKTVYGRSVYAIGGNAEAARLAGLRVDLIRASTYVLVGICAASGGMIITSRLGVGQADIGPTVALDAIAIVVIGGTSLLGGEGAVWRTAVGLLILAVLTNLLDSQAVDPNSQLIIKGVIVIAAVAIDAYARRTR